MCSDSECEFVFNLNFWCKQQFQQKKNYIDVCVGKCFAINFSHPIAKKKQTNPNKKINTNEK